MTRTDLVFTSAIPARSIAATLGWAVYLGISWTWCIGMFLPVLLLRDLGIAGFFVFAVPNVVGAAAMGWVLRDARQSKEMVLRHESACVWFSLVTIVFHAFFAGWIIRRLLGPWAGISVAVIFWVLWSIIRFLRGGGFWAAITTLGISLAAWGWGLSHEGYLPNVAHVGAGSPTAGAPLDVLWLAPVCILGFGLCPYLDLTFHHARQNLQNLSPRASGMAFGVGFGVVFAAMLIFTVCYSGWLAGPFNRQLYPALAVALGAHLVVQSCFTVAAHTERLAPEVRKLGLRTMLGFSLLFVLAVVLGALGGLWHYHHLSLGELVYRCFMAFYGLVFPAYVWLRIVPPARGRTSAGSVAMRRFWLAVIIAMPMYWLGFIERKMLWLVPGVAVVVLARYALPRVHEAAEDAIAA